MNNRVSQSVPHLHIHVVPRRKKDGLKGFFWPRQSYESEAMMREIQQRLHTALAETRSSEGEIDEATGQAYSQGEAATDL